MAPIEPAHIALIVAALGLVMPVLTALAIFMLQRLFGTGDKASAQIDALESKVHALELTQVGQYVTKGDMDLFRTEVRGHFQALRNDFNRVLAHYGPNAAFPD